MNHRLLAPLLALVALGCADLGTASTTLEAQYVGDDFTRFAVFGQDTDVRVVGGRLSGADVVARVSRSENLVGGEGMARVAGHLAVEGQTLAFEIYGRTHLDLDELEASVPTGTDVILNAQDGVFEVSELAGDVTASLYTGLVDVTTDGVVDLMLADGVVVVDAGGGGHVSLGQGRVEALVSDGDFEELVITAVNAPIWILVAPDADVDLDLRTGKGAIRGVTMEPGREYIGSLGEGGARVEARTGNGDIFVLVLESLAVAR